MSPRVSVHRYVDKYLPSRETLVSERDSALTRERETERQTDRQTERQKERQRDTEREREE